MPTLVHLTDERNAGSIRKNGMKPGKYGKGIYCMPVLQNFYVSHQWLRELKRFGGNTFVSVYFKVDSKTKVFAGKFNEPHQNIELGKAITEIQNLKDPLGYELIIDRKIEAKEIQKISHLPQTIGWRYKPGSKGQKPCGCEYCVRGKIKAKSVREKYGSQEIVYPYSKIVTLLKLETDKNKIYNLLSDIRRKKRRSDPTELMFLIDNELTWIHRELALTLCTFRHKNTKEILLHLLKSNDAETKENAADSFLELYGSEGKEMFVYSEDEILRKALSDWREEKQNG